MDPGSKSTQNNLPLDPKTMKHEGFNPQYMGEITPKNEGTVGS